MEGALHGIKPFETCSIRPPTENCSLSFKLTRNCYWNRCAFCPVYKFGARFSKRSLDEVREDIGRAKRIDDVLFDAGIMGLGARGADLDAVEGLVCRIEQLQGMPPEEEKEPPAGLDPRLEWFLPWFREQPGLRDSFQHVMTWRMDGGRTCFLGDADSLILDPGFLSGVIGTIQASFPTIERFTVYGRTKSAARLRTAPELEAYRKAGLDRVHFGLESGCDEVLASMDKGVTSSEHIEGLCKAKEAGLSCSVYVMPGLGGRALSGRHARDTAGVISKASPDFVRLRSLQIFPGTPLEEAALRGEFAEASEEDVVSEIRTLVEEIEAPCTIMSDSASNLLDVGGTLPSDRAAMLEVIDGYLALPARGRLLFSLQARISHFVGQYGGLSSEIYAALAPYLRGNRIDPSDASDDDLRGIIRLVRSRLMP